MLSFRSKFLYASNSGFLTSFCFTLCRFLGFTQKRKYRSENQERERERDRNRDRDREQTSPLSFIFIHLFNKIWYICRNWAMRQLLLILLFSNGNVNLAYPPPPHTHTHPHTHLQKRQVRLLCYKIDLWVALKWCKLE